MKPTGVNLNDILYFDPDTLVIMPGTVYFNPNAEVKTVDNEVGMKSRGQNLVGRFCFNVSDRKRILNNIHRDRAMPCLYQTSGPMTKNKKHKKPASQSPMGAYKHFLNDMYEALLLINVPGHFSDLSEEFKKTAYQYKIGICNPIAGNKSVSSGELKFFTETLKKKYRERVHIMGTNPLSNYQLQLLYAFSSARLVEIEKQIGDKKHPDVVRIQQTKDIFLQAFITQLYLYFFGIVTRLSSPDRKYYGVYIRLAPLYEKKPKLEFFSDLFGYDAQNCMISINGYKRPAFRLAKPIDSAATPVVWLSVDVSLLGNSYTGHKKTLDVYIQKHALTRLKERLDLLDQEATNYALWENTHTISKFVNYRGYLLLPFNVFGIKTGYLVANIIDDKLLFRTFLFITHNTSPEGVRLKKLTGLGKEDITYWKIDRLSTFVKFNEEKYPGLTQLFRKAGLETLFELKNKEFSIDSMQAENFDGLVEYINRGKSEFKLMNLSLDTLVSEIEVEVLTE